jgi:uncharacterized protein YyaL (SSP411 family)
VPSIDWLPWATAAFQRAQQARRPVLLLLDVAWSTPCRHLADVTFARPDIVELVEQAYVPVRVDADWRPDIADRYGLGAWPAVLALTPEGHVMAGGTPGDVDLRAWLRRVDERFRQHDGRWPAPAAAVRTVGSDVTLPAAVSDLRAQLLAAIDPASGAFGAGGQPALGPALAALAWAVSGLDDTLSDATIATIERLLVSARWDAARGLLLCRGTSLWHAGESFARLGTQAEWVRLLARAFECDPRPEWRAALTSAVSGLRAVMRTDDGVTFVDATSRACRALLAAAQALDDETAAAAAIETLEAMLPRAYTRGAGVAHVLTTRVHGPALLADAMLVAHALLDADPWRAQPVYRDLAEELVRSALSRLRHESGALVDRRPTMAGANAVGLLAQPMTPLEGNADAARACVRCGPEDAWWLAQARQILSGVHAEARVAGGFAAPPALAWAAVLAPNHAISVW